MQLMLFDVRQEDQRVSSFGRTFPASFPSRTTPSDASSVPWQGQTPPSFRQGENGQTQVWLLDPKDKSLGEFSTLSISEWPRDAAVCSLWQVLEQGSIPPRFFLSSKACAGILRRAAKRGKTLPPALQAALESVAIGTE
jgi:hypothetical protein